MCVCVREREREKERESEGVTEPRFFALTVCLSQLWFQADAWYDWGVQGRTERWTLCPFDYYSYIYFPCGDVNLTAQKLKGPFVTMGTKKWHLKGSRRSRQFADIICQQGLSHIHGYPWICSLICTDIKTVYLVWKNALTQSPASGQVLVDNQQKGLCNGGTICIINPRLRAWVKMNYMWAGSRWEQKHIFVFQNKTN